MRIHLFFSLFLLLSCNQKKTTTTATPIAQQATQKTQIGIFKNASVYAAKTDYEFEIDGRSILIPVKNIALDSANFPDMPSNLTVTNGEGIAGRNPLLVGQSYQLEFAANNKIKSIRLEGAHDPSNPDLPAIPNNYTGLLDSTASHDRIYLNINADLSAILMMTSEQEKNPIFKYGLWSRTAAGEEIRVQFGEETWVFLVREAALVLTSVQASNLSLMASEELVICDYVKRWLSYLSTVDGLRMVDVSKITTSTPLSEILRTEHAYMKLYGELEEIFKLEESIVGQGLRKQPNVQGICDLITRNTPETAAH